MDNVPWFLIAIVAFIVMLSLLAPRGRASLRRRPKVLSSRRFSMSTSSYLPYERQQYLLTRAERNFYEVLHRAVGPNLMVFPKVRLADVMRVPNGTPGYYSHFNRISAKHVDFLICTCDTLSPALVVELDDSSHERTERRDRDDFVDSALASAGLPILHVPARSQYNLAEIAASVQASILPR